MSGWSGHAEVIQKRVLGSESGEASILRATLSSEKERSAETARKLKRL